MDRVPLQHAQYPVVLLPLPPSPGTLERPPSGRDAVEQVFDGNGRAVPSRGRLGFGVGVHGGVGTAVPVGHFVRAVGVVPLLLLITTVIFPAVPSRPSPGPVPQSRRDADPGHHAGARERLPPEPERPYAPQVVDADELRGAVPFARQGQVGGTYARAVVAYGDGVESSADGRDVDPE